MNSTKTWSPRGILARLPASLSWAVLFRTKSLTSATSPAALAPMFGLPEDTQLDRSTFVVLTSAGKGLVAEDALRWLVGAPQHHPAEKSLQDRLGDRLALLPDLDNADCVGAGALDGGSPAVMALRAGARNAIAEAIFDQRPLEDHYELLAAVGVRPLGGEPRGERWCARFSNELGMHLGAAALAGFARTAHCNAFFLNHGRIDGELEQGLLQAAAARVHRGLGVALARAVQLTLAVRRAGLGMTCVPPSPDPPHEFGDLVPLGFLLLALESQSRAHPGIEAAALLARRHLDRHRSGLLWPFQHGRLPTAIDTALILLGHRDRAGVEALERFGDGNGAYLPQHMRASDEVRHWCQVDFPTTCLVRALRRRAGLAERTPLAFLETWFEKRAGLFFANPYLVDWALAMALEDDPAAGSLRGRLCAEVRAGTNEDGSFGRFDCALSTALAILALSALGVRDRTIRVAQVHLAQRLEATDVATPFYSSELLPGDAPSLSWYEDTHAIVFTALAALALQAPCDPARRVPPAASERHPRYRAATAAAYVAEHALPPYVVHRDR